MTPQKHKLHLIGRLCTSAKGKQVIHRVFGQFLEKGLPKLHGKQTDFCLVPGPKTCGRHFAPAVVKASF